jgi:site-specific recombinase XerD
VKDPARTGGHLVRRGDALPAVIDSAAIEVLQPGRLPLSAYVEPFQRWLEIQRGLSEHTVQSYGQVARSFVSFAEPLGLTDPDAVRPRHVEGFLLSLRRQGRVATTVNHRRAALVTWWRFLVIYDAASTNPAKPVYGIKEPKRLPKFLTPKEQDRVLNTLGEARSPRGRRDFAMVATMILCGLRVSEVVHLRTDEIDLETGLLRVTLGKGRKDRIVPVIPWLRKVLAAYLDDVLPLLARPGSGEWAFLSRAGRQFGTRVLYEVIRRVVSPIVGRPVHPHVLRHSFATRALMGGGNVVALQMAMGHASPSTTMIYTHIPDADYQAQLAQWLTGQLEHLAEPAPVDAREPDRYDLKDPEPAPAQHCSHPFADPRVRARLRARRGERKSGR